MKLNYELIMSRTKNSIQNYPGFNGDAGYIGLINDMEKVVNRISLDNKNVALNLNKIKEITKLLHLNLKFSVKKYGVKIDIKELLI